MFQIFIWFGAQFCGEFMNMLRPEKIEGNAQYCKAPLINQILSFKDAQIRKIFTLDLKNSFIIFKYIKKNRIAELTLQIK